MSYKKTNEPGINLQFFHAAVDEAGATVSEQRGNLYTVLAENANATACYLQFFNAADIGDVTVGTTPPVFSLLLHANSTVQIDRGEFPIKYFSTGICVAATSTRTGAIAPAADPQVTLHFQ